MKQVTQPGGAVTSYNYALQTTSVTDPALTTRSSTADALGRLVQVIENSGGSPSYTTYYAYDVLDDLKQVCQNGALDDSGNCIGPQSQSRNFVYDGLKRLLQATNPENGTIIYTYDSSGNLSMRTQAGVTKHLNYDGLNRLKDYNYGGPAVVALSYDQDVSIPNHTEPNYPKGRLVKTVAAGVSETDYRYDALGRVVSSQQVPSGQSSGYIFGYGYDLAGAMTSMTYPSGRTLSLTYDAAGQASSAVGYVTNLQYAAHGGLKQMTLATGNSLVEETCYNQRLQATGIRLGTTAAGTCINPGGDLLNLGFTYGNPGSNNGNVTAQNIVADGHTYNQAYAYDVFNRLTSAVEAGARHKSGDHAARRAAQ